MSTTKSKLLLGAFITLLFLVIPWGRSRYESSSFLERARNELAQKNYEAAGAAYRQAIWWDAPFNTTAKEASVEFFKKISDYPLEKQPEALWNLRAGMYSSRSLIWDIFDHPFETLLISVDTRISLLQNPSGKALLKEFPETQVSRPWQLASGIFFISWIALTFAVIRFGFSASGSITKSFWKLAPYPVLLFFLWVYALSNA